MVGYQAISAHVTAHQERLLDELLDFLRIPSVSTLPEHQPDVARAAEFTAAALRAAGLSPELARELAAGRAFARLSDKLRAAKSAAPTDGKWWRGSANTAASREQQLQLRRELSDALVAAFGDDLGLFSAGNADAQFAFLSPEKRAALRRITQDYDEMIAKFSAGGIQLPSDKERLRLLREERERDIAALLSPDERLAYELRTSATAAAVRARYGDGLQTEDDYRKVYALQIAFDEKFPADALTGRVSMETMRARSDAQRQLQDDIRTAIGDTNYAALRRATDSDLRNVDSLVSRLNLPANTTDRVAAGRETLAAESQRINADTSVPFPQRRAAITELSNRAKSELTAALGAEAGEAYAQRSPWVSMLNSGMAYSTTPTATTPTAGAGTGQAIYPVLPAGVTAGAGNTRVMVNASTTEAPVIHGGELTLGGNAVVRDNVQVMTFTSSAVETTSPVQTVPPGAAQRTIIVAPPAEPAPKP